MTEATRPPQITRMNSTIMMIAVAVMLVLASCRGGRGRRGFCFYFSGRQWVGRVLRPAMHWHAVVGPGDTVDVDTRAEWNCSHDDGADEDDAQNQPAVDADLGGRIAFVGLLDEADDFGDDGVQQHQWGDDEGAGLPHHTDADGGDGVEVLGHFVATAEHPRGEDQRENRTDDDADVIGPLVHDVQGDQAAGCGEQQGGDDAHDGADDDGRGATGKVELVLRRRDHDLHQGDQGGQSCDEQGDEEQDTEDFTEWHFVDDGREGDERQADTGGRNLGDLRAGLMGHEAQRGEHTDSCQQLEGGVRERGHHAGVGEVGAWLQIGRVGGHDAEADGQGEEDLAIGSDPHARVAEDTPVWGEECVQAVECAVQKQCADDHDDEQHDQHRNEDRRQGADSLVDVGCEDDGGDDPHQDDDEQDWQDELTGVHGGVIDLQEVAHEVLVWLVSPAFVEGLCGVDSGPGDDGCVINSDEEGDADLQPTDRFGLLIHAAVSQGSGCTESVADAEVKP